MASFKCKDIGMNCGFEIKNASSKDEVMKLVAVHAKETHKMDTVSPDLSGKIMTKIKE
jgi:predicted small metal-binding protein